MHLDISCYSKDCWETEPVPWGQRASLRITSTKNGPKDDDGELNVVIKALPHSGEPPAFALLTPSSFAFYIFALNCFIFTHFSFIRLWPVQMWTHWSSPSFALSWRAALLPAAVLARVFGLWRSREPSAQREWWIDATLCFVLLPVERFWMDRYRRLTAGPQGVGQPAPCAACVRCDRCTVSYQKLYVYAVVIL